MSVAAACEVGESNNSSKQRLKGLFLMVPAVYLPGYGRQDFTAELPRMCIVHAWGDDILPFENSLKLAKQHQADFHLFAGGHRLSEPLEQVKQVFKRFVRGII